MFLKHNVVEFIAHPYVQYGFIDRKFYDKLISLKLIRMIKTKIITDLTIMKKISLS